MSAIKLSVGGTAKVTEPDPRVAQFTDAVDTLIKSTLRDLEQMLRANANIPGTVLAQREILIRMYRDAIEYMDDV